MQQVQQALRSLLVLSGVTLGTAAAVAVVLGFCVLALAVLNGIGDAYDVPFYGGD